MLVNVSTEDLDALFSATCISKLHTVGCKPICIHLKLEDASSSQAKKISHTPVM